MKPAMTEAPNSPSVYSERSLQRVASMASRAERGECSALHDGVVGARRAGELQTECVEGRMEGVSPFIRILRGLGLLIVSLILM